MADTASVPAPTTTRRPGRLRAVAARFWRRAADEAARLTPSPMTGLGLASFTAAGFVVHLVAGLLCLTAAALAWEWIATDPDGEA